ncbi:plasmid replication protein RepC [Rhizobium sp. BK377]|uniref:plasmid replication protein RepC n=1 Tax=Rhizobium sp. BK377 TaxID=2587058 RepID=UPI001618ED44|nr:plasmid replication protein RepC [Rhizobium sp. BK377]MBB3464520.1 replication initiation protein RepC [Rhizobium sp. BK377]
MNGGSVTTPFGRRPMTLGMFSSQVVSRQIEPDKSVDKWKLYRALCEARVLLGISDRALAVMNALLSFYPKNELSEENGLVVFPSNVQLSLRAHGMAEQTIRRHLAVLVGAGLLIRKDSPNGKRYARKDRSGSVEDAFGFSLAPLLARSEEIETLAAQVVADRLHLQRLRERLTLCRRDISKLVETALEENLSGDWNAVIAYQKGIVGALTRNPGTSELEEALEEMEQLREDVVNQLENLLNSQKTSGNARQSERHIQSSNPDSISELEPGFETKLGAKAEGDNERSAKTVGQQGMAMQRARGQTISDLKSFPLGLVLQACPQISDYAAGGAIGSWRELMSAAVTVRAMLGVSPSAYQDACDIMGPENAATVIACILERGGHINSAGGYLRDLTRRTERGEFALGPMLMALYRSNGDGGTRAGNG